jgi:Fanconi anemia group M protein
MINEDIRKREFDDSFLASEKIEYRDYQINIADKCINKNSLVVLPTGMGKTIIAVLVAAKTLEIFPPESKIIILAPTRPLINQHYLSFLKFLNLPENKFSILTGRVKPDKRTEEFEKSQVLFYTPQTLRNDLVNKRYSLDSTCLLIFDEAHHASGDYPYSLIAEKYIDENSDGNILALTASPGATKSKITQLCNNLNIPLKNIHIRSRKDGDVKEYIKPINIYKIGVELTSLMEDIYSTLKFTLEQRLQFLSQHNFLQIKSENLYNKIIRKDLVKLNSELIKIINGDGNKTNAYSSISINAQSLIIYHMIELLEQQGLDMLLEYLEKLNLNAKKKNSSKAVKRLATDPNLRQIYLELSKVRGFSPEKLIHPKFTILEKIILDELKKTPTSRILVFVKLRDSVRNITNKLKFNQSIRPKRFVGQAKKSEKDKGLSQKKQIEILEQFKNGNYNVLISTNVGEEGLDIAECDLVVFFDVVASEIRLIQRKGRTARHREGKVIILYCKGTNDEKYLGIALNKLKKMDTTLRKPQDLQRSNVDERRMFENNKQYEIDAFIDKAEDKSVKKEVINPNYIQISNSFPMKFGLRKRLNNDGILFQTTESDNHIVISNKIVIHIYDPKHFSDEFKKIFLKSTRNLFDRYTLIIAIFDFLDFKENFEGENRLKKREIQAFGKLNNIQIITIDNSEELFFIVKNIYDHSGREGD